LGADDPGVDVTLRRRFAAGAAATLAVAALALPVFAASPSPSAGPSASGTEHGQGNGVGNGHGNPGARPDASESPEVSLTLQGTVVKGSDGDGHPSYTLSAGGTTYVLSFGPWWFWGDKDPLNAYVGKSVTIAGEREGATNEVDVQSVDGKALRDPGKPPWAGGPKVVGPSHPGYKAWKAAQDKAGNATS
jgi:hypothetical protein